MEAGIIYYNVGSSCLERLLVSIYSLRRYYSGRLAILYDADLPERFQDLVRSMGAYLIRMSSHYCGHPLVRKANLWHYSPFDRTVFLDSDTLICDAVDELFECLNGASLVVTRFANWSTFKPPVFERIYNWLTVAGSDAIDAAIAYPFAVNTGVLGWQKNSPFLREWGNLTARGHANGMNETFLDEIACQILLPRYPHYILEATWNASGLVGPFEGFKIVHFHGNRQRQGSPLSRLWLETASDLLRKRASASEWVQGLEPWDTDQKRSDEAD